VLITYAAEVLIQQLHIAMNDLQCQQLVVVLLDGATEIQAGIPIRKQTVTLALTDSKQMTLLSNKIGEIKIILKRCTFY